MFPGSHLYWDIPFWRDTHRCALSLAISTTVTNAIPGMKRFPAGRINEAPAVGLSGSLRAAGFQLGRLQTGTPARLDKNTIDFSRLEKQEGDKIPHPFSFLNRRVDNEV